LILKLLFGKAAGPLERLPIDPTSPWWGEHRSRYRLAQAYVKDKCVLDIACGTGFGCDMMREAGAKLVVGADITFEAVRTASRYFNSRFTRFVQANGITLPFKERSFDVVTSFETLEHIYEYQTFLKEVRRVLRDGGRLLLSTPNAVITNHYPRNPFHVREFTPAELHELLAQYCQQVELRGQLLDSCYRVAPFLPGKETPETRADHVWHFLWKVGNRLPFRLRDSLAMALLGRHFYPGETDYIFDQKAIEVAPVLVAIGIV